MAHSSWSGTLCWTICADLMADASPRRRIVISITRKIVGIELSYDPPALGFPEPPNVSLRLISVRFPFFWAQMDAVVLAVYVSLSISWLLRCSGCDLWPTFRPTCAQPWEVFHVCRLNRLLARWLGGGGVGWRGALASTSRSAKASSPMTALFYSACCRSVLVYRVTLYTSW